MSYPIRFDNVSKIYQLGAVQTSLREVITKSFTRLRPGHKATQTNKQIFYALKEVGFDVSPGEALGLIGHNGAGKTTALKLISRVTRPSSGKVQTQGRITSLIELGAGFHPELSGRENIFLNGAIMGLGQQEIRRRFDQIIDFAEIEEFLDTPIKRYSSGMQARLGFAVAAHVDPDILLVDEVLAVGDSNFQRKCLDFIHKFVNSGHTTVFVSHNLFALEQLCNRIIWLDHGCVMIAGPSLEVLSAYMKSQDEKLVEIQTLDKTENSILTINNVFLTHLDGSTSQDFLGGEDIQVNLDYYSAAPIERPHFVLAVWDRATRHPIFIASMLVDGLAPASILGPGRLKCTFKAPPLMPRAYQIWGEVWTSDRKGLLVRWQPFVGFSIEDRTQSLPGSVRHERADAPVRVAYTWDFDQPVVNQEQSQM